MDRRQDLRARLRYVPRISDSAQSFGDRDRDDAEGACTMSTQSFVPPGWPRMATRIFADDARGLVRFLAGVFDASGDYQENRPSEIRIGDSVLLVSGTTERRAHG